MQSSTRRPGIDKRMNPTQETKTSPHIAFIGGGNMASAIISGLIKQGHPATEISVVDPSAEAAARLTAHHPVKVASLPGPALAQAQMVVWAVKPQHFKEAALQSRFHTRHALHLSIAAGIPTRSIAGWLGSERVIRAMPNTPALVGRGMSGLFAMPGVNAADREWAETVLSAVGERLWVDTEDQLDAVTALSGSGPAYVFYFLEAMTEAGSGMGLSRDQSYHLAVATFVGASRLAQVSDEPPEILRQRVTSKGGTTYAAITSMEQDNVKTLFVRAIHAARQRARELGEEYGG